MNENNRYLPRTIAFSGLLACFILLSSCIGGIGGNTDCYYFCQQEGEDVVEYHWDDHDNDPDTPCIKEYIRTFYWDERLHLWMTQDEIWGIRYVSGNQWKVYKWIGGFPVDQYDLYELIDDVYQSDELEVAEIWTEIGDQLETLADFLASDNDYVFDEDMAEAMAEGLSFEAAEQVYSEADLLMDFWHPSYDDIDAVSTISMPCETFKANVMDYCEEIGWGETGSYFEDYVVLFVTASGQLDISIYDGEEELFDVTITKSGGEITSVSGTCEGEDLTEDQEEHPILVYQAVLDDREAKANPYP